MSEVSGQSSVSEVSVSAVGGLAAIERYAADIDRLNACSGRPNPFNSSAFLRLYGLRIEYFTPGREERLFLMHAGGRVIGAAPMRRSMTTFGAGHARAGSIRLQFLAPLDTESPAVLAAPQDEARVARALVRYLCEREADWGLVEFAGQRRGSALHAAVHAASTARFRPRDIDVNPYHEVAVTWPDLGAYFRSLTKKMRSNVSRQARRLFAAGEPQLVLATGAAVPPWFEAYLELEGRSWKSGTGSAVGRHPRRVRFYRELAAGAGGFLPEFIGIVLDGMLVAGLLMGCQSTPGAPDAPGAWCLEMAYDQSRADLGPGQLLLLLAVGRSIETGRGFLNFMQNFSYYKHRWAAQAVDVVNVQLIRRASLHGVAAMLGDLRRRRGSLPADAVATFAADASTAADPAAPGRAGPQARGVALPAGAADRARELTAAALRSPAGVRRLEGDAARAALPFDLE